MREKINNLINKLMGTKWFPVAIVLIVLFGFYYACYMAGSKVGEFLASFVSNCEDVRDSL